MTLIILFIQTIVLSSRSTSLRNTYRHYFPPKILSSPKDVGIMTEYCIWVWPIVSDSTNQIVPTIKKIFSNLGSCQVYFKSNVTWKKMKYISFYIRHCIAKLKKTWFNMIFSWKIYTLTLAISFWTDRPQANVWAWW
jgi:hypothetical protein